MKQEWKRFPLTLLLTAAVWVVCLMPVPATELSDVPMIDKWTHLVMYGGLTLVFWTELWRSRLPWPLGKRLAWGVAAPVVMSGIIELMQAYCTGGNRSGEWLDFAANTLGVALGCTAGLLAFKWRRRC